MDSLSPSLSLRDWLALTTASVSEYRTKRDADVHFFALMGSLLASYPEVARQEVVPGEGSALFAWLQVHGDRLPAEVIVQAVKANASLEPLPSGSASVLEAVGALVFPSCTLGPKKPTVNSPKTWLALLEHCSREAIVRADAPGDSPGEALVRLVLTQPAWKQAASEEYQSLVAILDAKRLPWRSMGSSFSRAKNKKALAGFLSAGLDLSQEVSGQSLWKHLLARKDKDFPR